MKPQIEAEKSSPPPAQGNAGRFARRIRKQRWKVQLLSFLGLNALVLPSWQSLRIGGLCVPVLNCHGCPAAVGYCPVGVIGDMLSLRAVPWLALGSVGLVGVLLGRLSCAWMCPFGYLQDLLAKLRLPAWKPPRWTRLIKYAVLAGMVFAVPLTLGVDSRWFFCGVCPEATLWANGWFLVVNGIPIPGIRLVFLALFLLIMLFISRGFCRIVCPIGAGLGLLNRVRMLSLRFRESRCTNCTACVLACPMGLDPRRDYKSAECILCLNCLRCGALSVGPPRDVSPDGGS